MVVGARQAAGPQAADLLGFSHWHKHLQGLQRMVPKRGKYPVSQRQQCGGKDLVNVRGQSGQTGGRPQKEEKKGTKIATGYNRGLLQGLKVVHLPQGLRP